MTIKASHLFWAGTIGLVLLNSPGLTQKYEASQALREKRQEAGIERQASIADAKLLQARSAIALERIRSGCVPVSNAGNTPLVEGEPVGTPNGSPLSEGQIVCNSRGETAVAALDGEVSILTKLATASEKDLPAYERKYQRILNNVLSGGVPSTDVKTTKDPDEKHN